MHSFRHVPEWRTQHKTRKEIIDHYRAAIKGSRLHNMLVLRTTQQMINLQENTHYANSVQSIKCSNAQDKSVHVKTKYTETSMQLLFNLVLSTFTKLNRDPKQNDGVPFWFDHWIKCAYCWNYLIWTKFHVQYAYY